MNKTPRSSNVTGWMQSFKAKAMRVAGDRSSVMQSMIEAARTESQRTSIFLSSLKAKAQSVAEAAAAAAAVATGSPVGAQCRSAPDVVIHPNMLQFVRLSACHATSDQNKSRSTETTLSSHSEAAAGNAERYVQSLTKAGWSPVAARLALCRTNGGVQGSTAWLADDANSEEILAVEAAERWAAERQEKGYSSPASSCTEDFLAAEECNFNDDDDGHGLGMGRMCSFRTLEAPALDMQAMMTPARSLRATASNSPGLCCLINHRQDEPEKEQEADVRDAILSAASPQAGVSAPRLYDASSLASPARSYLEGCSEAEHEDGVDEIIEGHEEHVLPEPPHGGSWEWPLSRCERKERDVLLDRQMNQLDKSALIQALIKERTSSRTDLV